MEQGSKMSTADYIGTWVNGIRYSQGSSRFRGQTRDKLQLDGSILRTTYGFNVIGKSKMVATISERIKPSFVIPQHKEKLQKANQDIVDKMLNNAYHENQWHEDSHV